MRMTKSEDERCELRLATRQRCSVHGLVGKGAEAAGWRRVVWPGESRPEKRSSRRKHGA